MPVAKEPTGWVQDIAPPPCSFLRRKVASVGFVLVLLMNTNLLPEMRIADLSYLQ